MVTLRKSLPGLVAAFVLTAAPAGQAMVLTSPDFANDGSLALAQVNTRCGGQNRSPALRWSGAPSNTQSYALTLFDPDANGGRGFWHWIVFNIPATTTTLPAGAGAGSDLPAGAVQAENGFGEQGYGGACPPPGTGSHHYQFTLYAFATTVPFGPEAKTGDLLAYFRAHMLVTATLVGLYKR